MLRIITLPSSRELDNEFILLQHTYGVNLVDRVNRQDGLAVRPYACADCDYTSSYSSNLAARRENVNLPVDSCNGYMAHPST